MRKMLLLIVGLVFILAALPVMAEPRPDAPPYALRGPFAVGAQEFAIPDEVRPLHGTVWYPALNPDGLPEEITYREMLARVDGQALQDAAPDSDSGPYPLIIYSHGLGGFRFQSAFYVEHLASYGFVVMAIEHPGSTIVDAVGDTMTTESIIQSIAYRPLEVLRVIDFAGTLNDAGGVLEGIIDLESIGLTGHSFGGYTIIATGGGRLDLAGLQEVCQEDTEQEDIRCQENFAPLLAEARGLDAVPNGLLPATSDPGIRAVVAQAPAFANLFGAGGLADMAVPTMIQVGSLDHSTPAQQNANHFYQEVTNSARTLVTFEGAGHYIFVEECTSQMISFGYFDSCSDKVWDMARAHDLINHFSTAFFLTMLKDDPDSRLMLETAEVEFPGIGYQTTAP